MYSYKTVTILQYSQLVHCLWKKIYHLWFAKPINTLRTGDADLLFYITTVQDG